MARRNAAARVGRPDLDATAPDIDMTAQDTGTMAQEMDAATRAQGVGAAAPSGVSSALPRLDRVIHERVRLGIVSALAANDCLSFNDLKRLLEATDGNISVHAAKLEEAGYIASEKFFAGRVPRTEYRLTEAGRRALDRYLDHMEALIRVARQR